MNVCAWKVSGEKPLADGGTIPLLATSFGSTEDRARENWHKLWGKDCRDWTLAELTFTREEAL